MAGTVLVVEGIHNQLFGGHTTPCREVHITVGTVFGQTVLEELLAVSKNILRDITKVEVQFTALMLGIVDERIHHPELDVLVVGGANVGVMRRRIIRNDCQKVSSGCTPMTVKASGAATEITSLYWI